MLAIQAPPAAGLITPARRDSPRPAAIGGPVASGKFWSDITDQRLCAFGGRGLIAATTVRTVLPVRGGGGRGGGADVLRGAAGATSLVSRHRQGRPDPVLHADAGGRGLRGPRIGKGSGREKGAISGVAG